MKKFIVSCILSVTVLGFIDSIDDASKTYVILDVNGKEEKLKVDKKEISCKNCIWKAVKQMLDQQRAY